MSLTTDGMTPADLAAVTGCNNGGMFGNEGGAWWIIILFLFIFMGNGGGVFGNNAGAADNYVLASDFANISRQIDNSTDRLAQQTNQIASGLSSLGYDQLAQMNGINQNIIQTANNTQRAIDTGFAQMGYNNATSTCAINSNVSNAARDIVESQNCNTRAILDAINAQAVENKNTKIAEQSQQIFALQLAASQQAQNNYLIGQLKQCPIPAYTVPNPYGCGCNCNG